MRPRSSRRLRKRDEWRLLGFASPRAYRLHRETVRRGVRPEVRRAWDVGWTSGAVR